MKKRTLKTLGLVTVLTLVSGCSTSNTDSSVIEQPEKITFLENTLNFECTDRNESFYSLYFGVTIKNETEQVITNENLKSIKLEAELLNINDIGREVSREFLAPANGIEPGKSGLLAFNLNPSLGFEWKSVDIFSQGKRVLEKQVYISENLCN